MLTVCIVARSFVLLNLVFSPLIFFYISLWLDSQIYIKIKPVNLSMNILHV